MSSGTPQSRPPERLAERLHNSRDQIEAIENRVLDGVAERGYPEAARFAIRLALEEAITNAFRHGHRDIPDTPIEFSCELRDDVVRIGIRDAGPGFDPGDVPDPTLEENLERPTGRGIMLIRAFMTDVRFNKAGNEVTMVYDRAAEDAKRKANLGSG